MMILPKARWLGVGVTMLLVAGGGLVVGKAKEKAYLASLYERRDFTLLDDQGDFFQLSALPTGRLALLVFTPDGIPTQTVKPFFDFSCHLAELKAKGIDVLVVSRTNREIVRNFLRASGFTSRYLIDVGGSVGRILGVWPDSAPVAYWGYALVDRSLEISWAGAEERPLSYEKLVQVLRELKPASQKTASGSP